jgi:hypothetical protein
MNVRNSFRKLLQELKEIRSRGTVIFRFNEERDYARKQKSDEQMELTERKLSLQQLRLSSALSASKEALL